MTRHAVGFAAVSLLAATPGFAELPDFYRTVSSVHWVVADLAAVTAGWAKLGFPAAQDLGEVTLPVQHRGQAVAVSMRVAVASFAGVDVVFIQPFGDKGAFAEFLAKHGSGIMSLNHNVPSIEALNGEVARLGSLGVPVLQRSEVDTGSGLLTIAYMDTEPEGKYVLGLVHGSLPIGSGPSALPYGLKLSQYSFVVKDLKPVSAFWEKLGFPAMDVTSALMRDRLYRGQPGQFEQELGWQRQGGVVYEWIRSTKGPTVYEEYVKAHGEGVQHLAFDTADLDKVSATWEGVGFKTAQSGGWGDTGKRGSGRFAYIDADAIGGILLELLWRQP